MSETPDPTPEPGPPGSAAGPPPAPASDPWKGFRGVCAGTLVLEMIVVLLTLPILAQLGGGITWLSGGLVLGSALAMFLGAGLQGRSWAMTYNLAIQVVLLLGFFVDLSIGFVGVLFGGVWAYLLHLRGDMRRRIEKGQLPSQRSGQIG